MYGVRQFFGGDAWKRRGVVVLILTCWAIQGIFIWSSAEHQRVDAALGREDSRFGLSDMSLTELKAIRVAIEERRYVTGDTGGQADDNPDLHQCAPAETGRKYIARSRDD